MIPLSRPEELAMTFAQPDETLPYSERLRNSVSGLAISPTIIGAGAIAGRIGSELITNPQGFADLIGTAFNQNLKVESLTARNVATEEAYDRRIKAIKEATGVTLENPLRGGFRDELARANREDIMIRSRSADQEPAAPLTGGAIFERKLSELRAANPDKAEALAFGDITAEAKAIAKGAEDEYEHARKATTLSLPSSLAAQFIGGAAGQYRDPLFVGSLVAGPTTAVGKTVAARIASAGLFQGLYNAGISALEQPVVQEWRREIGVKSGVVPALENVGLAFVFGAIPGAAFRGGHEISEAAKKSFRRVLDGVPLEGDLEKTMQAARSVLGEIDAEIPGLGRKETAAIKLGEEMDAAEKATRAPPQRGMSQELHDDLTTAAQRYGDDPVNAPSPQGVAAVSRLEQRVLEGEILPPEGAAFGEPEISREVSIRQAVPPDSQPGFTPTQMKRLLDAEQEQILNMWHSAKEPISEDASDFHKMVIQGYKRELDRLGVWQAKTEDEVLGILYEKRGDRVKATKGETVNSEISDRIAAAEPRTQAEAQKAASDAIEDIGNRGSMARTRMQLDSDRLVATEKITGAAIRTEGGIFVGPTHSSAYAQAADAGVNVSKLSVGDIDGFMTSAGRFVSREEAARIADTAAQRIDKAARLESTTVDYRLESGEVDYRKGDYEIVTRDQATKLRPDIPPGQISSQYYVVGRKGTASEGEFGGYNSLKEARQALGLPEIAIAKPPAASSKDPLDKIPLARDDGTPTLVSARQAARAGERETALADIIRECK